MAIRFRKSIKVGPARINFSSRGVGWSVGGKGVRVGYYPSKGKKRTKSTATTSGASDGSTLAGIKLILRLLFIALAATAMYRYFPHSAAWAALFALVLVLPIAPLRRLLGNVLPTAARRTLLCWLAWMSFYVDGDTGVLIFAWVVAAVWTAAWAVVSLRRNRSVDADKTAATDGCDSQVQADRSCSAGDAGTAADADRDRQFQAAREELARERARAAQNFKDLLDGLATAPVIVDAAASLQPLALSDMPEIHYTSISASFNRDTMPAFVVIDTETTGLSARSDGIVELSAIRFEEFHPVAGWTTLVDPGRRIPPEASAVNNITDAMVSGAPTIDQVAQSFLDFCGSAPIVGYNLPFDFKMLYAADIDLTAKRRKYYDVCAIAKKYFKGDMALSSYKLGYVASQCGLVPVDSHRSLSDCLTTGLLLDRLISIM